MIDLLNLSTFKKPLQVRWSRVAGGFYVENLFTVECEVKQRIYLSVELRNGGVALASRTANIRTGWQYLPNFVVCVTCIQEFDDLLAVLEEGMKNRAVGSHG